ncbi:hypothetical protein ACIG54_21430 [Streptomyces achromogenes]|uniref:hypothetical protein n=1 Tax=Streptomyces achromogenes TaxID=67255 RepID=UPI003438D57E
MGQTLILGGIVMISLLGSVPRRVTGAAFAAVLLAGGMVGCGGGSGRESAHEGSRRAAPVTAVREAAVKSERITSLHYRVTGTVPEKGRLEAEAFMRTEPAVMKMKLKATDHGSDGRLEIRFVDEVMYVSGTAIDPKQLDGKSWFTARPAVWGRGSMDNKSYRILPSQIEGNPTAQFRILTASQDVRRIRTETIDGTRTTHYRGTVTGQGIRAARDAAANRAARERQIDNLDQFMMLRIDDTLTMDLWIGDDNHTKQFRMRGKTGPTPGDTDSKPLDLTIAFLDINQSVSVEAPPPEDTADLAVLAGEAQAD